MSELTEDEQMLLMTIQEMKVPGLVLINYRSILSTLVKFLLLPLVLSYLFFVFLGNLQPIVYDLILFQVILPKSFITHGYFILGILISGVIFYLRQTELVYKARKHGDRIKELEGRVKDLEGRLTKLKTAASTVSIPYPLDSLVDKGLDDFLVKNARLRALPVPT